MIILSCALFLASTLTPTPDPAPADLSIAAITTTTASAAEPESLLAARRDFKTTIVHPEANQKGPAPTVPPPAIFKLIKYPSPTAGDPGELHAYLSPDPGDGKKHPAIIVASGGFGGIGSSLWTVDRYSGHFRDAGLIVLAPSWRGQHDNPGASELFFGEVDDCLAAITYLKKLPYVDPSRIYMTGHSTGGTMAMLAALACAPASADGKTPDTLLRAAFPLGGCPDIAFVASEESWPIPFERTNQQEIRLRSPIAFVDSLKVPTFYFEGSGSPLPPHALDMQTRAMKAGTPFNAFIVEGGDHFNIADPINALIAARIKADTGPAVNISFTAAEVQDAFDHRRPPVEPRHPIDPKAPVITLTPAAIKKIKADADNGELDLKKQALRIAIDGYYQYALNLVAIDDIDTERDRKITIEGITFVLDPLTVDLMRGTTLDYDEDGGFDFTNPNEH